MQPSVIRKDYFLPRYVLFTPSRAKRPHKIKEPEILSIDKNCPFCQHNIDQENIVDLGDVKGLFSLNNIYPAVSPNFPRAYGRHEVVVETLIHRQSMVDFSLRRLAKIFSFIGCRFNDLTRDRQLNYLLFFKNEGAKAGASIAHSHSQIFASSFKPEAIKEEQLAVITYQKKYNICPYCQIVKKELNGPRFVWSNDHFVAFCPYASQYHYEIWIMAQKHNRLNDFTSTHLSSLADLVQRSLKKLRTLNLSYNFHYWQTTDQNKTNNHFCLKIQPRDNIWAGIEMASGLIINSVLPEKSAKFYKK